MSQLYPKHHDDFPTGSFNRGYSDETPAGCKIRRFVVITGRSAAAENNEGILSTMHEDETY
jgi:hypothetical protein